MVPRRLLLQCKAEGLIKARSKYYYPDRLHAKCYHRDFDDYVPQVPYQVGSLEQDNHRES